MKISVFKSLSLERQLEEIISFGKPIDSFTKNGFKIVTYQMDGFVVDTVHHSKTNTFHKLYFKS